MEWSKEIRQNVQEASEATRFRCLSDEGELDPNEWLLATSELLEDEYLECEEDLKTEGRLHYIQRIQQEMRQASRKRVYQYQTANGGGSDASEPIYSAGGDDPENVTELPPLPTLKSLKGEMVSVPQLSGQAVAKLVLMCTPNDLDAVVQAYAAIAAQNQQRRSRYNHLLKHMRNQGFGEDKRVKDLY